MSISQDLPNSIFVKTEAGQQEILRRTRGLSLTVRRILVLVDGQRNLTDLAALLPDGADVGDVLRELIDKGLVIAKIMARAPAAPEAPALMAAALQVLPPAKVRTEKDNDMARHFMMNSVNAIIGQGMRISLMHDIFHADTTHKLREVFFAWEASMSNHSMGARRLPELREQLFKVL